MVEKKNIDWGSLGFAYQHTDFSYVSNYRDGAWDDGALTPDHTIVMSECAGLMHYCQEVFEGLKAYTTDDGRIVCFRPDQNAARMYDSAQRICMPPFPKDRFVEAVERVVKANEAWVPPFGTGATLYIRPFMFATGDVIGVKPADEYQFRILVTPVGAYYKGGVKPVKLQVSKYDRAAPHGTGNIKAGLNYAMELEGGKPTPGIGFAVGFERIALALAAQGGSLETAEPSCVYVACTSPRERDVAFRATLALRQAGIRTEADYQGRSLKSQFKQADRLGAVACVVIGPDEVAAGVATLRDMVTHEQVSVPLDGLVAAVTSQKGTGTF